MHELAKKLLRTIRKQQLLLAGDRLAVAVSGGADSVALLCLLEELRAELGVVLSVVHVNHKLRGAESDEDERFVMELAAAHALEFHAVNAPVESKRASGGGNSPATSGVESAARRLRYEFFRELANRGRVGKIATAHTLDDQAETVLLRIFRGTGIRGLAGIHPRLRLENHGSTEAAKKRKGGPSAKDQRYATAEVVRPLLGFHRAELREYLHARGQSWREDSSNENLAFLRNRVRRQLLPLIAEDYGEATIEHMAELAEIARADEEWCSALLADAAGAGVRLSEPGVDLGRLLGSPLAVRRRLVRAWIETNAPEVQISFRLIEEILELARGEAGKKLELPTKTACGRARLGNPGAGTAHQTTARQINVRRGRKELMLEARAVAEPGNYQYALAVPGEIAVPELGVRIEALLVDVGGVPERERQGLLDPRLVGSELVIRNWRPGDRYWPAHTAAEKKVKELLSDKHATGPEKKLWPVAVAEGGLVWMRGFPVPDALRARTGRAIWIREIRSGS
ncbi:MAG: tRNA lysidine(34) synthetase TilS [Terriglobales bacterium]